MHTNTCICLFIIFQIKLHFINFCGDVCQFLAARSYGSPVGTRKTGRSSVFSLFNLKEKSRFWSEDVLHSGMCILFSYDFPLSLFFRLYLLNFNSIVVMESILFRYWRFGITKQLENGCSELHQSR